jgi:hypothetical protein
MSFITLDIKDVLLTNRDRLINLLFNVFSLLVSFIIFVFAHDLDFVTSRTTFENEFIKTFVIIEIIIWILLIFFLINDRLARFLFLFFVITSVQI